MIISCPLRSLANHSASSACMLGVCSQHPYSGIALCESTCFQTTGSFVLLWNTASQAVHLVRDFLKTHSKRIEILETAPFK